MTMGLHNRNNSPIQMMVQSMAATLIEKHESLETQQ
jgi:hypothetical protein